MTNLTPHSPKITPAERRAALSQNPFVLWFTGLSGSGKSTIAAETERELFRLKKTACLLDGDNLRLGINSDLGFSEVDRRENIRRITEISALFLDAGLFVLVSAISPAKESRVFARERLKGAFVEIYVKADVETCVKRDPKGLYKKALAGEIQSFTGISSPYEPPENPEILLDTDKTDVNGCVRAVMDYLKKRGL